MAQTHKAGPANAPIGTLGAAVETRRHASAWDSYCFVPIEIYVFSHKMAFLLYDYVDEHGRNQIYIWTHSLQTKERIKLQYKLDDLVMHGEGLRPQMLTDSGVPGVLKLRVHGGVQLRPLLCKGPVNMHSEFTLLAGAIEIGSKLKPAGISATAAERKEDVRRTPHKLRKLHEDYPRPTAQ